MSRGKLEIPFEGNDLYYSGLRSIMSSSIYSVLGVFLYMLLLGKLTYENLSINTLTPIISWVFVCGLIWVMSYIRTNRVLFHGTRPKQRPIVAKFFLVMLYIIIGAFCALFYDTFTMMNDAATKFEDFKNSCLAFSITAACLFIFLYAFSHFAIRNIQVIQENN